MRKSIFDLTRKEVAEVNRELEKTKYHKKQTLTFVGMSICLFVLFMCIALVAFFTYVTITSDLTSGALGHCTNLSGIFTLNFFAILVYLNNSRKLKTLRKYYNEKNNN